GRQFTSDPRNHSKEHNLKASDAPIGGLFVLGKRVRVHSKPSPRPVDTLFHRCYIPPMELDVEFTDEFEPLVEWALRGGAGPRAAYGQPSTEAWLYIHEDRT